MPCPKCRVEMTSRSLTSHRQCLHVTEIYISWDSITVSQYEHLTQVYEGRPPRDIRKCQRPFPDCPGLSHSRIGLRNHFNMMHWQDSIQILEDHPVPYPHCEICGRQVPPVEAEQLTLQHGPVPPHQGLSAPKGKSTAVL